ncbi:MAG: FUSC family protein [Rhodomicrobium sp.]|jgi:uncharacterized membrane protein YccC
MDLARLDVRRLGGGAAFAFRLTAAALLALWLAGRFGVALPLWSVITALVVTQVSLGRSLKATLDYFAATIGGVLWGGFIAIVVPHSSESALLLVLLLALAPLAFAAALYPRLSAGPVTAAIVVLIPQMMHTTPIDSAIERIVEVLLGGLTGLFVSFVLLPWSAFQHAREVAAQSIQRMAQAIPGLIKGFEQGLDEAEAHRIQDGIGRQLNELSSVAAEAERERPLRISGDPLTGPLFRTLLRLRHDLVIIGRAARAPLPAAVKAPLLAPLESVGEEIKTHLQACAAALMAKQRAPSRERLDSAFARYVIEIETLRSAGHLRKLPSDVVERLFAAGFALEQTSLDLRDLDRCVDEWAPHRG